uniref:Cysteine sulfinic acid decarboxylase n=1 Tax=Strix occidentalis caurina TaxID=311401 RepID=A0A8D0F781_STROC
MAESNRLEHPGVDKAAGEEFLREALQVLLDEAVRKGTDVTEKVCDWKEPGELRELLDLELRSDGEPPERLLGRCRDVIRYSVRTGHPRFFNQLFSGLDHHALAGRLITEALNTSQYTYEIAPVFVLMEEVVLAKLRELVGWSCGDGIFAPGGSISNMYAVNVARFHRFPESRRKGSWALPRLALFTSREVRNLTPIFSSLRATTPSRKEPLSWALAPTTSTWSPPTSGESPAGPRWLHFPIPSLPPFCFAPSGGR